MSLGIALMNKRGVVLASDSASFSYDNDYCTNYKTVQKIFNLSDKYPLACIAIGDMVFGKTPIELILNEFKKTLATEDQPTELIRVHERFIKFLDDNRAYFNLDHDFDQFYKEAIVDFLSDTINKTEERDMSDFRKHFDEIKERYGDIYSATEEDKVFIAKYRNFFDEDLSLYRSEDFKSHREELWELVETYLANYAFKKTTFIFAGYPKNKAFPSILKFNLLGYNGKTVWANCDSDGYCQVDLYNEDHAMIMAGDFQTIDALLDGFTFDNLYFTYHFSQDYFNAKVNELPSDLYSDEDKEYIRQNLFEVYSGENLVRTFKNEGKEQIRDKFELSIQNLNLIELREVAKKLVDITRLKSKFCLNGKQQSVGGPTDVATLTLDDNFEWVEHKEIMYD